jgi:hypothetical protein
MRAERPAWADVLLGILSLGLGLGIILVGLGLVGG